MTVFISDHSWVLAHEIRGAEPGPPAHVSVSQLPSVATLKGIRCKATLQCSQNAPVSRTVSTEKYLIYSPNVQRSTEKYSIYSPKKCHYEFYYEFQMKNENENYCKVEKEGGTVQGTLPTEKDNICKWLEIVRSSNSSFAARIFDSTKML